MKGLTNATSQDVAWCPKHQTAKWCCWFDGHCLTEKDDIVSFFKEKILFSFTHASSSFPLETSGSFFKFNSFHFIYLFIFFKFNYFYLFIRSLQIHQLYTLQRGWSSQKWMSREWNYTASNGSGNLSSVKYPIIVMTPKSTLNQSRSTYYSPI